MQKKILDSTEIKGKIAYDHFSTEMLPILLQKVQAEHFQPDQATKTWKVITKGEKKFNGLKEFN